jgi:hypothetical protein
MPPESMYRILVPNSLTVGTLKKRLWTCTYMDLAHLPSICGHVCWRSGLALLYTTEGTHFNFDNPLIFLIGQDHLWKSRGPKFEPLLWNSNNNNNKKKCVLSVTNSRIFSLCAYLHVLPCFLLFLLFFTYIRLMKGFCGCVGESVVLGGVNWFGCWIMSQSWLAGSQFWRVGSIWL